MSAPAPPSIPPRPVKQQAVAQGVSKLPDIPPRPSNKRVERSTSPGHFPGSPLNEPFVMTPLKSPLAPLRPPSVSHLPTPGEEGMEYANIQYSNQPPASALAQDAVAQTRTVAEDLHLHAPKPSLPKASATAQVQGVTKTDLPPPVNHGIGRSSQDDLTTTRTRSRQSFSRPDSAASGDRRRSVVYGDEIGPAEMGLRVPINPLLGDVQAPTPQGLSPQATGESPRRHSRKKSAMDDYRPPDSYGLHGHGTVAPTRFEREWYAKHPDQLEHEEGRGHGVYEGIGSGRGSFALSSDELNKLVRDTASRGAGFGTKENIQSYPDEQIGYYASEEYQRSQQNTPHPEPISRLQTRSSQANIESPLRRTSFPAEEAEPSEIRGMKPSPSQAPRKSSGDDLKDVHHIDLPARRYNKITGGQETANETQDAKPYVSHSDDEGDEHRVPILAEDEVAKSVGGEFLHPAVSPKYERRGSQQYDDHGSGTHTPTSRPASRPGSIYQMHSASHSLSRFLSHQEEREHMHTPLEDVAEYEPLFEGADDKKGFSTAERFKRRPDALQKRFPSQDIWEDTPSSAMYVAEVSTPDLPSQLDPSKSELNPSATFETSESERARKGEATEEERKQPLSGEERMAKSDFAPHLRDDMPTKSRPVIANRFPSRDIWEDTPDSSYLVTTVGDAEEEETSPIEAKPPIPARPAKSRLGEGASSAQIEPSVPPAIPARPPKRLHQVPPADAKLTDPRTLSREVSPTELKKTPSIPDRPKPQIPPRPGKKQSDDELTKVTSGGSNESTDTQVPVRSKPQVPARPGASGNIAGLKGNFMSDLNKRLGLGPPKEKEKEPEPEAEAKPLEDARKSRARGPQRRAPAKAAAVEQRPAFSFSIFSARSLWQINEDDELNTMDEVKEVKPGVSVLDHASVPEPVTKAEEEEAERPKDAPAPQASALATNTAGEPADPMSYGDDENPEGELTRKTTASTISGDVLDREDSPSTTHMMPASQQTTAEDSDAVPDKLEKVKSAEREAIAEDQPIQVRNEQVNAPAPDTADTHKVAGKENSVTGNVSKKATAKMSDQSAGGEMRQEQIAPGEDKPQEPMNENDVDYGKLEEMTAKADGKLNADDDPQAAFTSKKIMD